MSQTTIFRILCKTAFVEQSKQFQKFHKDIRQTQIISFTLEIVGSDFFYSRNRWYSKTVGSAKQKLAQKVETYKSNLMY